MGAVAFFHNGKAHVLDLRLKRQCDYTGIETDVLLKTIICKGLLVIEIARERKQ